MTTAQQRLREIHPTVIRGNASEIRFLLRSGSGTKGVDSQHCHGRLETRRYTVVATPAYLNVGAAVPPYENDF